MSEKCGAKTRSGAPCKRGGMANGRCKLHGGMAEGRPVISGRYSVKHRATLAVKMEAFRADPRPGDLADELALMRSLLADYLERFSDGVPLRADDVGRLFDMLDTVSKLVERIYRIKHASALTAAEVAFLQARLADLMVKYVPDFSIRERFLLELSESFEVKSEPY